VVIRRPLAPRSGAALLAALAIGVLAAAPVQARDAECLWSHLSPHQASTIIAVGEAKGLEAVKDALPPAELRRLAAACGFSGDFRALGVAFYGLETQRLSEAWFSSQGLGPERLDAAWAALDPDLKMKLIADMQSPTTDDALIERALGAFAKPLHLPAVTDEAAVGKRSHYLGAYIAGRTLRAIYEPQL
jgi:hypothetical protein